MSEKSETPANPSVEVMPPIVHLDDFIRNPNPSAPKILFSLRLPAEHQAKELSIVRMQNCDMMYILQNAKMLYRDKTKFTVSVTEGSFITKLHFLMFPNRGNEIQIDYTYTPQVSPVCEFSRRRQIDEEIGQYIRENGLLRRSINEFAYAVYDTVSDFANRVYKDSTTSGKQPDYLITTPPLHP